MLDFESLAVNDNQTHVAPLGYIYTEDGFTISNDSFSRHGLFDGLRSVGTQQAWFTGSTALHNNWTPTTTNLSQVGGGGFTLSSIDLADLDNTGVPLYSVSFTGTKVGGGTITQSFSTDALPGMQTFTFSNFNNLAAVDWTVTNGGWVQFDNINVNGANATSVPEPFTVLGTIFGAGYGVSLKRKLAKAKLDKEDIS